MVEENLSMEENVKISAINRGEKAVEVGEKKVKPGVERIIVDKNLVVDEGLKYAVERLWSKFGRPEGISHIGFGTDNSSTTSGMTELQGTEAFRGVILDENVQKVENGQVEAELVVAPGEPSGQPYNFGEVGLFTDTDGGSEDLMFSRVGLGADEFEKTAEIEVRIRWQIGIVNQ